MVVVLKELEDISLSAAEEVLRERGIGIAKEETADALILTAEKQENPGYRIVKKGNQITVRYCEKVHFFRAAGEAFLHEREERWEKSYTGTGHKGVQYDCSRNAVLHKKKIKELIRLQAVMGLDRLYLYTEDTYEVKNQPYFGHLRGKLTKEEIRECDEYAKQFGIELIPSIQVLAHLRTALRWPAMQKYRDNEDILLVDEDATYELIEDMISGIREMYSAKQINLGMDEAFFLGFGNYRLKHGIVSQESLMKKHLARVSQICKKYDFYPMMWSDMFFRNAGKGNYYRVPEDYEWKEEERPDKNTTLIYWDYYECKDSSLYRKMAKLHKKLTDNVCFAGGGWIWNGLAPNYGQAISSTTAAFRGLQGSGLEDSFFTMWQDNGAETPVEAGIPMIAFYSSKAYGEDMNMEEMEKWYRLLKGESYRDMMLLDKLDAIPGTGEGNADYSNPTKALLYQDPLVGLFDLQYGNQGLDRYYKSLAEELKGASLRSGTKKELFQYYSLLAGISAVKCDLGCHIRTAYLTKNITELQEIAGRQIPQLMETVDKFKELRHELWEAEAKENGWEILDIRISSVMARLKTASERLTRFINGEIDTIEELEEDRLFYLPQEKEKKHPSCNLWENIISAANIGGV